MKDNTPKIVRTTTLEMTIAPRIYPSLQIKSNLAIMHVKDIPLSFYRYLYAEVGSSHFWYLRNHLKDHELSSVVHSEYTQISVLYCDGAPAGFGELDYSEFPAKINLVYFGLCPIFIGRGLGKWFLGQTIKSAWEKKPDKLMVSTDTLDHPHALPSYQKMGFTPISFKDEKMEDWLQNQAKPSHY